LRIFTKKTLREYWEKHADCERQLNEWYKIAQKADWKTPHDVKNEFANASIVPNNRVVFNIKGNDYRLVVKFNYQKEWGFIRFIGTHSEYNDTDVTTI